MPTNEITADLKAWWDENLSKGISTIIGKIDFRSLICTELPGVEDLYEIGVEMFGGYEWLEVPADIAARIQSHNG